MTLASHVAKDARLALRDWKGLLVALALPVVIIFAYARLDLHEFAFSGRNPDAFILVLAATFPVLLLASGAVVQERRQGTFQRLARSPANLFAFFAGKLVAAAALLALQVAIILLTASLLLPSVGAAISAHALAMALVLLLAGIASYALGLLLSAVVGTETQASQVAALALLLMLTLSGFLAPLDQIGPIGAFAAYLPVALGYAGARALLDQTAGAGEPLALVVVALALVLLAALASFVRRDARA